MISINAHKVEYIFKYIFRKTDHVVMKLDQLIDSIFRKYFA